MSDLSQNILPRGINFGVIVCLNAISSNQGLIRIYVLFTHDIDFLPPILSFISHSLFIIKVLIEIIYFGFLASHVIHE